MITDPEDFSPRAMLVWSAAMDALPIVMKLDARTVLLVGGSEAALAKLRLLARTPARIRWFSDGASALPADLPPSADIVRIDRGWRADDLLGVALVYGATGSENTDRALAAAARARGVPVNIVDRPELCDFTTPAIVDRNPLLIAISTNGAAPVFARRLRMLIERLVPASLGRLVYRAGEFRARLAEILPAQTARRRFWDALFDSHEPARLAALDAAEFRAALERRAQRAAFDGVEGLVQLVGAGPGDPELLTLKAQRALGSADVVLYDRLVDPAILDLARRDADLVFVGKARGDHGIGQQGINALMIAHARAGKRVVRLKSGDPLIFGRAGEEMAALREAGIAVEIIPGISAVQGCAATAMIPLTHRDHASALTLVTGQVMAGGALDWRALAGPDRTLAIYMGIETAADIEAALLADGVDPLTPIAIIENGARPEERRIYGRLQELSALVGAQAVESPALLLIGAVTALADDRIAALGPARAGASFDLIGS